MYIEYELSGFDRIWKVDEWGVGYRWVMSKEDLNILVIEYSIWEWFEYLIMIEIMKGIGNLLLRFEFNVYIFYGRGFLLEAVVNLWVFEMN